MSRSFKFFLFIQTQKEKVIFANTNFVDREN